MLFLLFLLTLFSAVPCVHAQQLDVASQQKDFWFVQPHDQGGKSPSVAVYHMDASAVEPQLTYVHALSGVLSPHGLAASGNTLWLAYKLSPGVSFLTISPIATEVEDFFQYESFQQASINFDCTLRGFDVDGQRVFALVHFDSEENAKAAEKANFAEVVAETPPSLVQRLMQRESLADKNLAADAAGQSASENQHDGDSNSNKAERGVDRLLITEGPDWVFTPLPIDWPHGGAAWVLRDVETDQYPLLAARAKNEPETLRLYRWRNDQWQRQDVKIAKPMMLSLFRADSQLVLASVSNGKTIGARFYVIRGDHTIDIGMISPQLPTVNTPWATIPFNNNIALVTANPEHEPAKPTGTSSLFSIPSSGQHNISLLLTQIDLQGKPVGSAKTLTAYEPQLIEVLSRYFVSFAVLIAMMVLLMIFMMRDPKQNQVALPADLQLSDFSRRMFAAMIDFFPLVFVVKLFFGVTFSELMKRWPGVDPELSWDKMLPALIVIGAFLLHTTLSELLTGKTLGKAMMGIRVTNLKGGKPTAGQILGRNISKILELLVQILLIFPLISMNRQRVGDMAMQTIVVMPKDKVSSTAHLDQDQKED